MKKKIETENIINKLNAENLVIIKDLDVKGLLLSKKTNFKKIEIKKENRKIEINENSIIFDDLRMNINSDMKSINFDQIMKKYEFFQKISAKCNEKNNFCLVPERNKNSLDLLQIELLDNMRKLKNETGLIIETIKKKEKK